jgi:2-polyprenyl-6-methoxyphenol hydroxylase-like FAD-dependent oxidoreductase
LFPLDRGQGLNHCICDVFNLVAGFEELAAGTSTLSDVITSYQVEMVPRGAEEVKCSIENGYMLHDWEKVRESPVFRSGFKPMDGHDKPTIPAAVPQEQQEEVVAN